MTRKFSSILALVCLFGCMNAAAQKRSLRVITYNILEGMKLDTAAGKPGFVAWVKKMDPDISGFAGSDTFHAGIP